MSYFCSSDPAEKILDECRNLQETDGVTGQQIILALAKVMQYYAENELSEED